MCTCTISQYTSPSSRLAGKNSMVANTNTSNDQQVTPLSEIGHSDTFLNASERERQRPAIVLRVPNITSGTEKMKAAITTMDQNPADNHTAPILMLNEGNLNLEVKEELESIKRQSVYFLFVDSVFPIGFNAIARHSDFHKRSKWGYWQMCRFWTYLIWQHSTLDNYTSITRMNTHHRLPT